MRREGRMGQLWGRHDRPGCVHQYELEGDEGGVNEDDLFTDNSRKVPISHLYVLYMMSVRYRYWYKSLIPVILADVTASHHV